MLQGIPWFNSDHLNPAEFIQQAADYYRHTYDRIPDTVLLPAGTELPQVEGVTVRNSTTVSADHLWIGVEVLPVGIP